MPTIKDVADLANVSIATVSRVLNENGYVSTELDQRVRQAIAQLGYQPNALARNLRRSESLTLGVLIPDSNNPFFAEVAKGVEDVCFTRGFNVVLCNTAEDPEKAASYLSSLYRHRVAGFIVVSPGPMTARLQQLLDDGYPIVLADRSLAGVQTDSVVSDNYSGTCQAVQHLLDQGHRRIGFITLRTDFETFQQRLQGVIDTLDKAGVAFDPDLVYRLGDFLPQSGYAGAEALLNRPHPPTAIFAFNDLMAFGAIHYAYQHGIGIPSQLSVIGFDDIMMAAYAGPGLTTIAQPKYELGRAVAEILLDRIGGNRGPNIKQVLPTKLIVRGSTAKLV